MLPSPPVLSNTNSLYSVDVGEFATGLAMVALLNPADGVHLYVYFPDPPETVGDPPNFTLVPRHIVCELDIETFNKG